jgi:hypothetical protein
MKNCDTRKGIENFTSFLIRVRFPISNVSVSAGKLFLLNFYFF